MSNISINSERMARLANMVAIRDIASLMKEKDITQEQLAEMMGVKKQSLSRNFNNPESITAKTLAKIAKALDTPLVIRVADKQKLQEEYSHPPMIINRLVYRQPPKLATWKPNGDYVELA